MGAHKYTLTHFLASETEKDPDSKPTDKQSHRIEGPKVSALAWTQKLKNMYLATKGYLYENKLSFLQISPSHFFGANKKPPINGSTFSQEYELK